MNTRGAGIGGMCLLLALAIPTASTGQEVSTEAVRGSAAVSLVSDPGPPSDSLHQVERLNGSVVTSVFAGLVKERLQSVVPIETTSGKLVALSVVAASNGYLVSKASELETFPKGKLVARIRGQGAVPAQMVQLQKENDLALLRVECELEPIEWAASTALENGILGKCRVQRPRSGASRNC